MNRPMFYVSGRITAPTPEKVNKHIELATLFSQILLNFGAYIYCPHTHSKGLILSHEEWMELDLRILGVCDAIYMLPNWERSRGAQAERTHAIWLRLPVFYHLKEAREFIERWRNQ